METIRNYVEALFSSLPQTAEILKVKIEMLANLEEKYNALRAEGKGEHEAVGLIVSSIGSAEELRCELDPDGAAPRAEAPERPAVSPALAEEYRRYLDRKHLMIAAAVGLFILSPLLYRLFRHLVPRFSAIGQLVMFSAVAAGVMLCILSGRRDGYYRELFGLGDGGEDGIPEAGCGGMGRGRYRMTELFAGVVFPIAGIVYLCLGFFRSLWHPGWLVFPFAALLTGVVGSIEYFRQTR